MTNIPLNVISRQHNLVFSALMSFSMMLMFVFMIFKLINLGFKDDEGDEDFSPRKIVFLYLYAAKVWFISDDMTKVKDE